LWMPVKFIKSNSTDAFIISTETPLPDTTGPIIDNCGYLVGLNLAEGEEPVVVLGDEMSVIFDSMQIDLQSSTCQTPAHEKVIPVNSAIDEPANTLGQANTEEEANKTPDPIMKTLAASPTNVQKQPSALDIVPIWLWVISALIMVVVVAKFVFFLRPTKHRPQQFTVEPDTSELDALSKSSSIHTDKAETLDGMVVIKGSLGDDKPFRLAHMVNTKHIDVVIGQGDADICIEAMAVSSPHARLKSIGESLTISDLGSSHGTFIRDIPCLPNEVMMINPEDEILLGDVRVNISVQHGHGDSE